MNQYDNLDYDGVDRSKGVVVGYEEKKVTKKINCNEDAPFQMIFLTGCTRSENTPPPSGSGGTQGTGSSSGIGNDPGNSGGQGQGGSMARFALNYKDQILYCVSDQSLKVVNVSQHLQPEYSKEVRIGNDIETIFPYRENLFIGSQSGVYIYDISNPQSPQRVSRYRHVTSCDPVVAQGNYAYATLRTSSRCGGGRNVLDVIDISNISNPVRYRTYAMQEPYGLAIDGQLLFVCDKGLDVYDAEKLRDGSGSALIKKYGNISGYDVIANRKLLILTGNDGLYQYDYSDIDNIKLLSKMPVQ